MHQDIYAILDELGLTLPAAPAPGGIYAPVRLFGEKFAYCSGCVSGAGADHVTGKLGVDLAIEEGMHGARLSALNLLANLHAALGDLGRIKQLVKMTVYVNSSELFAYQPMVANAASELLRQLFGEQAGVPARSAVGVASLPGGYACEIELLAELW